MPRPATRHFAGIAPNYDGYGLFGLAEIDLQTGAAYNTTAFVGRVA